MSQPKTTREPIDLNQASKDAVAYAIEHKFTIQMDDLEVSLDEASKTVRLKPAAPQPTAQAGEACNCIAPTQGAITGIRRPDCPIHGLLASGTGKVPAPPQDWGTHIDKGPGATHFKGDDCAPPTPSAGEACTTCGRIIGKPGKLYIAGSICPSPIEHSGPVTNLPTEPERETNVADDKPQAPILETASPQLPTPEQSELMGILGYVQDDDLEPPAERRKIAAKAILALQAKAADERFEAAIVFLSQFKDPEATARRRWYEGGTQ